MSVNWTKMVDYIMVAGKETERLNSDGPTGLELGAGGLPFWQ
jgi:hypothetical protein